MMGRTVTVLSMCGLLAASLGASGCKGGGRSKEVANVSVSHVTKPTQSLPRGITTVAVIDSAATDDAEAKWSKIAANMISGLLKESARASGANLKIADRQNLAKTMAENDLELAGMVSGAEAAKATKVLKVDGLILSAIKVKVEKHVGTKRTITGTDLIASPYTRTPVRTQTVQKVTRNITVQCSFRLQDRANRVIFDHVSPVLRKTDETKPSPFWGSDQTEAELTPRDKIIGELVEKEVRRFIGTFLPVKVEETIVVHASKNDACEAGVRMLAAGEYDEAIAMFNQAIAESEEGQDKYATFGLGAAHEVKGEYEKALEYYRKAVVQDADGAEEAMRRVKARIGSGGG
jgi:tetratricopeptide (TPR) repeat protein